MPKLQKKPSALKTEHQALEKMKFINFYLCLWVFFALLILIRIRSAKSPESDPDPHILL